MLYPKLFEPGYIGKIKMRNRIVMGPVGGYFPGLHGEIADRTIRYFVERARGGAGLIIVGLTGVTPLAEPITFNYANLADDRYLPGHYRLVEAVHSFGAKIGVQLGHVGPQMSWADYGGKRPLSPSGIQQFDVSGNAFATPRSMTRGEIYEIVEYFATAAARARKVGYDLVELHGAHGYLLWSFLSPATNKRTDEFGGSPENRARFVTEITRMAHRYAGDDFPVGVRINVDDFIPGGLTAKESPNLARILEESGAAYINIGAGTGASQDKMNDVMRMDEGWKLPLWAAIKEATDVPTIAGGGNRSPSFCEKVLAEGKADFIGLARQFLADPYWPQKAYRDELEDICKCISCLRCLYALGGGAQIVRHCTVNAMWGREVDFVDRGPAPLKKKVLVVGGGPAGMEAARVASLRGHEVTLYDEKEELGGQLLLASRPPGKDKILWPRDYLVTQIKKQGVRVELGHKISADKVKNIKPDVVIVATGAQLHVPSIPGIKQKNVVSAWDVLSDKIKPTGKRVAVLGGGVVGCETAEFLAVLGYQVVVVEMLSQIGQDMEPINRRVLLDALEEHKVHIMTGQKVIEVNDSGLVTVDTSTGKKQLINAEQIVLAPGSKPDQSLVHLLEGKVNELHVIGDAKEPRTILEAIGDGFLLGHRI